MSLSFQSWFVGQAKEAWGLLSSLQLLRSSQSIMPHTKLDSCNRRISGASTALHEHHFLTQMKEELHTDFCRFQGSCSQHPDTQKLHITFFPPQVGPHQCNLLHAT